MTKNIKKIIGFLCSVVFCAVIAVGMPQMARAAEEVAIDETNFPDEVFRDYVSSDFDKNNDNKLSEGEIASVNQINVYQESISSLKGIEYFTALTKLDCSYNRLTVLDVSKNTALLELSCYGNKLTELDVSQNIALTKLACYRNELTKLDVSQNINLQILTCGSNQLTELDVSQNTALTVLDCFTNQLTKLDVSKNTALLGLSCYENKLTELDVSQNIELINLCFFSNKLTELDISKNIELTSLVCWSNKLTKIDANKNTKLTELICYDNQLTEIKLNRQTYDRLLLYKRNLHGDINLSNLQNVIETPTTETYYISQIKVVDITKPAIYKVNDKNFTIIYAGEVLSPTPIPSAEPSESPSPEPSETPSTEPSTSPSTSPSEAPSAEPSVSPSASPTQAPVPSTSPVMPSNNHIFSDYNYNNPITDDAPIIYGNGISKTINGKRVNNKALTLYTDILASYKHTPNSNGTVKSSVGKVIVAVTKTNVKPEVNSKNKVTDTSASNIAKAKIKNGQITVTAVGKEGGLVYLWVIDTGIKGVSASCHIDVKLAPKKIEVQSTTGTKLTNTKLQNGTTLDVHVTGLVGSAKTEDCTYTPSVSSTDQSYVQIDSKGTTGQDFTITAKGIKNNKDTKVAITFTCDQNGKKVKFSLTVTK